MRNPRNLEFWSALTLLLVTVLLMIGTYSRSLPLGFVLGPYRFTHWLSWIGSFAIALFTPIFHYLRRRYTNRFLTLVRIHVFSNLFSFMLISTHFAQQLSRSVHPEDRTGLTMYIVVSFLVVSGFLHRFQILGKGRLYPPHRNRFLHVSITTAFYIILIIHVLHNVGIL